MDITSDSKNVSRFSHNINCLENFKIVKDIFVRIVKIYIIGFPNYDNTFFNDISLTLIDLNKGVIIENFIDYDVANLVEVPRIFHSNFHFVDTTFLNF